MVRTVTRTAIVVFLAALAAGCLSEEAKKLESLRTDPSVKNCIQHMTDPNPSVRLLAAATLRNSRSEDPRRLTTLIEVLADKHALVRLTAISALKRMGPAARKAVPYLLDLLADRSPGVRTAVVEALGFIDPGTPPVVAALERIAGDVDSDFQTRLEAVLSLGRMVELAGIEVGRFAEQLEKSFGKTDPAMSLCSLFLALRAGKELDRILKYFAGKLKDDNAQIRRIAVRFIATLGPRGKTAVDALLRAIEDEDERVRGRAAEALGAIGDKTDTVVPALLRLLTAESTLFLETSLLAARAVAAFGARAVPFLLKKIESLDSQDRFWAVFILGEIGVQARPAAPALRRIIASPYESDFTHRACEIALERILRKPF